MANSTLVCLILVCLYTMRCAARPDITSSHHEMNKEKTYYIVKVWANFSMALEICKSNGMELATFDNEAEFNQLADLIKEAPIYAYPAYWVAGNDLEQRDEWRWNTTGREMTFLPWGPGQPDHVIWTQEESRCVAVREIEDGSSVTIGCLPCSFPNPIICEN